MEKKLPPSEDWPVWSPKLSATKIKNAVTIEEIEYEIGVLKQKRNLFTNWKKDPVMVRRIDNVLQYGQEKIEIIKLTQFKI